jgi:hypothetical protein
VFGSWAARSRGRLDPPPRDIGVVIVGRPSAFAIQQVSSEVEAATGLGVDFTVVSPDSWAQPEDDPVLAAILEGPLVELDATDA